MVDIEIKMRTTGERRAYGEGHLAGVRCGLRVAERALVDGDSTEAIIGELKSIKSQIEDVRRDCFDEDFEDDWLSEDELAAQDVARPKDIDGLIEKIRRA